MSESFEDEFDQFRREAEEQAQRSEHYAGTISRLTAFLEEHGVQLQEPDETDWYSDPESVLQIIDEKVDAKETELGRELTLDEAKAIAQEIIAESNELANAKLTRFRNRLRVNELAAILAMKEAIKAETNTTEWPKPGYKKTLQAQYIADSFGGPWLELIDEEFDGEPLTENDTALLADTAIEQILKEQERADMFNSRKTQMANLLLQEGVDITPIAEKVISQLCALSHMLQFRQYPGKETLDASFIERARIILIDYQCTEEAWYKLIDIFFTAM